MPKIHSLLTGVAIAVLIALPGSLKAGAGATGCEDLGGIAETPGVDFQSQIQPILDDCSGCHGESGIAGLDLRAGESFGNIVDVISTTNPSRLRVDPFEPDFSALFLAINCSSPGGPGFQMGNVSTTDRALMRDWIAQGALPEPAGVTEPISVPADALWALALLILVSGLLAHYALRPGSSG